MSTPIHPSLPLSRWITSENRYAAENFGVGLALVPAVFPGGVFLMFLHESVWGVAGADRPFSFLLAIAAWIICLLALFVVAWQMVTAGLTAPRSRAAFTAAAVTIVGTAIIPAVLGTTGVLNGVGFALVTLLAQAAWLIGLLLLISTTRLERFKDGSMSTAAE